MIKRFSCNNFRNIKVSDLPLSRINLLIGPNNSGKTNFIKALTFYSNMIKHATEGNEDTDFLNAVERYGWKHSKNVLASAGDKIEFEWHMDVGDDPLIFHFAYQTGDEKKDFRIEYEELLSESHPEKYTEPFIYFSAHKKYNGKGIFSKATRYGEKNSFIPFVLNNTESICSQIDSLLIGDRVLYNTAAVQDNSVRLIKKMEESFKKYYRYTSAEINTDAMRRSVDIKGSSRYLKRDGSNYSNMFNRYQSDSLIWKSKYLKKLQMYMRSLKSIDTQVRRDDLIIGLLDDGKELDLSDLSEGTLKLLVWSMLLSAPEGGTYELLALDEPENNLHPAWQHVLAQDIVESSSYRQCIISTHSPDFLDEFTQLYVSGGDVALLVFGGDGQVRRVMYEDIAEDIGDWKIGDLYRTEDPCLGGWPW